MGAFGFTVDDFAEIMNRREPLCEELADHIFQYGDFKGINHPLVQGIPYFGEAENALLNLRLQEKQKAVTKALEAKDWAKYVALHERPFRLQALQEVIGNMGRKELWELVGDFWIDSENIWQNVEEWRTLWSMKGRRMSLYMEREEIAAYRALPDVVPVFRGVNRRDNEAGLSWTTDPDKAAWFAKRYAEGRSPRVIHGEVPKKKVLAYFLCRGEREIVAFPEHVRIMKREAL